MNASGDLALSGGADQKIQLWDILGQKQIRSLTSEDSILAVSLSADGHFALVGNKNQTVNLWELVTGKLLYPLRGHTGQITSVFLSADGRFALSGSTDQTVLLWELDWELEAHNNPVDWDERALPYLQTFLALHTPYAAKLSPSGTPSKREIKRALTRQGRSSWSTQDFEELMQSLQRAGYGWLHPDGVWGKLQTLDAIWQGPPPFNVSRQSHLFHF
jgi:WD40 repeat protein